MRENLLFTTRNWFYRIMFLFVLVCTSAMSQAQKTPFNYGALELDKEYTMPAEGFDSNVNKGYSATFTAPKTGVLTCHGQVMNYFRAYATEDYSGQSLGDWDFASQTMTIKVTEGQVLYFNDSFGWSSGTFKLTMPGEEGIIVEMREASPADGSVAPTAAGGLVEVFFNVPIISTAAADLKIGTTSLGSITPRIGGTVASIEMASILLTAYDKGLVKEGDELTITFHIAAKNDTNAKGDYTVTYRCPAQIVHLKNTTHIPAAFLSYWVTGDMDGVLKLEFTGDLNPAGGNAVLGYGDLESETGDYYSETVPYTVEGNVLSLDLTGKLRTPDNMVPSGTNYGIMSLQIKDVKDAEGNFVYSEGQGTIGSYSYNLDYKLLSFDIDHEFIPAEGASLANENEVEIWLRGAENLIYNGVKFTYVEDGTTKEVVVTDVTRDELPGEVTLTVAIPEEVKGKTNIEVSLNDLQCKDGQDHQISARYDSFVVTVEQPIENTMEVLTEGTIFKVTVNNESVGYMEYEIHDLNPTNPDDAIIKSYSWLNKQENGSWEAEVYGDYKLIKGHDYAVVFTAWTSEEAQRNGESPVGTDRYIIHGATQPYMNSDLALVSMTPSVEAGFASEDDNVITLEFDGLVMLTAETTFINTGSGTSTAFEAIEAVDPSDGYSNIWKLTVPKSYFSGKSSVAISFVPEDMNGRRLNGNEDRTGEDAYFYYDIPCTFAIPDFTVVPADGAELKSLSQITVGYDGGINVSWDGSKIEVYSMTRELVATVVEETPVVPDDQKDNWNYQPKEMILTLDNTVDKDGSYYIMFPTGHFILGSDMITYNSKQTIVNFTINNPVEPVDKTKIAIEPYEGKDGKYILTFTDASSVAVNDNCEEKILIKNSDGDVVAELGNSAVDIDWDIEEWNKLVLTITEELPGGEYSIEFPEEFFELNDGASKSTATSIALTIEGPAPELASGTYYLKNVESGKFLSSGANWGTQATLGNGYDLIVTKLEDGKYNIDTKIYNGTKHYLGSNGFMDADAAALTITNVKDNVYTISADGTTLLAGNADNTVVAFSETGADNAYAQWQFLTREELFEGASAENPVNVTALIQGHSFAYGDNDRNAIWQEAPVIDGWKGNAAGRDFCAERYETQYADEGYNVGQTLTDMPAGVYQLTVQGFYRNGNNATASAAHNAGTESLDAYLYANDEVVALPSVYSEAKDASEGGWTTTTEAGFVPNTMLNAVDCFRAGAYKSEPLTVIVGEDGVLTLGIKKEGKVAGDWTIFDNFELTYLGAVPEEEFITVVTPTETTLERLNKGDLITITVADENVGYVEYEIHDLNPVDPDQAIIKTYASMPKQADGSFQAKIYGAGYKLIEGHDYAVIFTAYAQESDKRNGVEPIGTHTHILHGATPAYVNSDLALVSITPNEETGFTSEDDNVVTVEFSGLVKLESSTTYINLGMGSTQAFESIEAVEPTEEGLATTWKLTVPKSMFVNNSAVEFAIVAFDAEGRRLNGNNGRTGETAYFYYSMPCSFAIPDFTVVPADEAELKSLSEITVGYSGGINPSWDGSKVEVYSMTRELVATVVEETPIIPEEEKDNLDYQTKEMVLTLDNTIDKDGAYYILFPAGHFNLGSQFDGYSSKQTIVNFIINNPVEPVETAIAITDNGDGRLLLTFDEGTSVNTNSACEEKVVVKNAEGNVVSEFGNNVFEFGVGFNEMLMSVNGQLDAPGEYTIEFPAGFFVLDESGSVTSTAVTVKYVVKGEEPQIATYYLKNVESGLYLTAGNAWGTQATLGAHGLDLVITQLENGKYTIDTNLANGDKHYLGDGFMDAALTEWTISEVEEGVYNITLDGTNYIGYDGETTVVAFNLTDATAAAAQWTLVTKEDLLAEIAVATEENPADATFLITGQGFNRNDTNRNNAWEGAPAFGGDNTNFCAEKFNTTFDIYQTLTDVPNGYYIVTVQGFYRNGGYAEAAAAHNAGTEALNAVLYANNESTPIMSIFAESKEAAEGGWSTETETGYIPNNMTNASNVFTAGAYAANKLLVRVEDGTLTIGVKKDVETANDWTIFDNFELSYLGEECVAIDGINADGTGINADNFAVYTLTGVLVKAEANKADLKNLPAGIYIVNGKKYLVK